MKNSIYYGTTAEQEEEVDHAVAAALAELNLDEKPDYIKVKEIHDYIIRNTEYDMNERYCHTAYGGFVLHRAVADGMSLMFYRLCREVGLDVRVILGDAQTDRENDIWGDTYGTS